jgi:hypothetical protein
MSCDLYFLSMYFIQHCCIRSPLDFTVSEDAWIEPRTVAPSVLAVRRSATRLHLIQEVYFAAMLLTLHI